MALNKLGERCAVLLTSCIDPGANSNQVSRADPLVRLADYEATLRWWKDAAPFTPAALVYVDSSGWDLAPLAALFQGSKLRTEFISFRGGEVPEGIHYGYLEMELIEYALSNSALLREATHFVKLTGRLKFPTIGKLVHQYNERTLAVVDARRFYTKAGKKLPHVTTQSMIFDINFYRSITAGWRNWFAPVQGKLLMENFFLDRLMPMRGKEGVHLRFPFNVEPLGIGARHGADYSSPRTKFRNSIRGVLRRVAPWLWV